jgi:acetyl-CoA carboxylase biotin carboxyl carrier protein
MKISFLKKLIEMVESSEIEELEIRKWWTRVRITKSRPKTGGTNTDGVVEAKVGNVVSETLEPQPQAPPISTDENLAEIKSPMVGTFYRAPSPGAKPYVDIGERVQSGQVVCIIEAMKLMNEIESEVSGTIVKVPAENEQPVEFGQTLFVVSPA